MNPRAVSSLLLVVLIPVGATRAQGSSPASDADEKDLKSFLVDIGPGVVGAHEILGLSASAVSSIQSAKDLVAVVNTAASDTGKAGFGISYAPARSGFGPLALTMGQYRAQGNLMAKLWGNTTFSYAQGTKSLGGIEYQQDALAVQVTHFLRPDDDPVLATRMMFENPIGCPEYEKASSAADAASRTLLNELIEAMEKRGGTVSDAQREEILKTVEKSTETQEGSAAMSAAAVACATKAAKTKWNSSQIGLTLGQGWIRSSAGGLGRISLGRHAALTLAWAPYGWDKSLFNLTLRRVSREVDTSSLGGTPMFRSSSLAAVRYSYGYGDEQDTFLIAELSNARAAKPTEANAAFKSALGVDHRVGRGVWLEMRAGRSQSQTSGKEETKVLFSLKLSPEAGLPKHGGR